ncbi:acetyltransferase [Ligilactobacillus salitolerans]|uniref:Acetyltransferase n=1 Tax=Ligilactobacillus salitolerans TaxID=1808352 RepID=A0A401ISF0_9LACO|nr:GNAT family N-acetyltransferase [Ligilactobacillus salitolerans]GBG94444.1 acetyltransferase [Ligilactobacillus salitolerans]
MDFTLEENYQPNKDRFVHYAVSGQVDAEVDFTPDKNAQTYTIDSTVVDPSLRGQGIAGSLMQKMATHARQNSYQLINVCPYAVNYFDKHQSDYADVLK